MEDEKVAVAKQIANEVTGGLSKPNTGVMFCISRRIHLSVGLQYLILGLAAGKLTGSLVYFWYHMASLG